MIKHHTLGVQPVSRITGESGVVETGQAADRVERVAEERVSNTGQVNSNLMGASGQDVDFKQCCLLPAFKDARDINGADIYMEDAREFKPRSHAHGVEVWAESMRGKRATGHVPARASGPRGP